MGGVQVGNDFYVFGGGCFCLDFSGRGFDFGRHVFEVEKVEKSGLRRDFLGSSVEIEWLHQFSLNTLGKRLSAAKSSSSLVAPSSASAPTVKEPYTAARVDLLSNVHSVQERKCWSIVHEFCFALDK